MPDDGRTPFYPMTIFYVRELPDGTYVWHETPATGRSMEPIQHNLTAISLQTGRRMTLQRIESCGDASQVYLHQ